MIRTLRQWWQKILAAKTLYICVMSIRVFEVLCQQNLLCWFPSWIHGQTCSYTNINKCFLPTMKLCRPHSTAYKATHPPYIAFHTIVDFINCSEEWPHPIQKISTKCTFFSFLLCTYSIAPGHVIQWNAWTIRPEPQIEAPNNCLNPC